MIPLGLAAANKRSNILMHVDYRVKLLNHDYAAGSKHKLIPNLYVGIVIADEGLGDQSAVTYSGPTYFAIRIAKHNSSSTESHQLDFERLSELPEFKDIVKINESFKPMTIISSDRGPDENPR